MSRILIGVFAASFFGLIGIILGLMVGLIMKISLDQATPIIAASSILFAVIGGLYYAFFHKPTLSYERSATELVNDRRTD